MQPKNYPIKEWALEDQPRAKFLSKNPMDLSTAELLATIIGNGPQGKSAMDLGHEVMRLSKNDLNRLYKLTAKELMKIHGIGEAKAVSILAALELGRRRHAADYFDREIVSSSRDVATYMRTMLRDQLREVFAVLYLSVSNRVKDFDYVSQGGLTATVVDPRVIIKKALEVNAVNIILCHNHPSGGLQPSLSDRMITRKIIDAAKLFDIQVIDHLIVSEEGYYSFADDGQL
ncbi:RadC family protein [Paraflavitalea pollutisoli]|uniref:RadC family protein n=1 Tax=Paraflavitalea pollutisoli TaxID=3034143 RepID=UPI0023EE0EA9|nr:DNA repair protein RadC [Paraflavitalea sp. H1-2-19X]